MIDEDYTCIAVSIYHLDNEVYSKMSDKDVFFVLDPLLKSICINYNGTVCLFTAPSVIGYSSISLEHQLPMCPSRSTPLTESIFPVILVFGHK